MIIFTEKELVHGLKLNEAKMREMGGHEMYP